MEGISTSSPAKTGPGRHTSSRLHIPRSQSVRRARAMLRVTLTPSPRLGPRPPRGENIDDSRNYQDVLRLPGKRAVNVVAVEVGLNPQQARMMEAKACRVIRGQPKDFAPSEIASDFDRKAMDTRTGLSDASEKAADAHERTQATLALAAKRCQVVLHLEPYAGQHRDSSHTTPRQRCTKS